MWVGKEIGRVIEVKIRRKMLGRMLRKVVMTTTTEAVRPCAAVVGRKRSGGRLKPPLL